MLIGRLPSALAGTLARRPQSLYGGPGLDPALIRAFLGRFGPYRLQSYAVPMPLPSVISARWFQPHGLPDAPAPVARAAMADLGRGGGNGRGAGGARSANRGGGPKTGGKVSGPGGPRGGRSGPVSRG